jgi:hypothetical protein
MNEGYWSGVLTLSCMVEGCNCRLSAVIEARNVGAAYAAVARGAMHYGWAVSVSDPEYKHNICPCH